MRHSRLYKNIYRAVEVFVVVMLLAALIFALTQGG